MVRVAVAVGILRRVAMVESPRHSLSANQWSVGIVCAAAALRKGRHGHGPLPLASSRRPAIVASVGVVRCKALVEAAALGADAQGEQRRPRPAGEGHYMYHCSRWVTVIIAASVIIASKVGAILTRQYGGGISTKCTYSF